MIERGPRNPHSRLPEPSDVALNEELINQAVRLTDLFAIPLHMVQNGISIMSITEYFDHRHKGEINDEDTKFIKDGIVRMTEDDYKEELKKNGAYQGCLKTYKDSLPLHKAQLSKNYGAFNIPLIIDPRVPSELLANKIGVDPIRNYKAGNNDATEPYIIWTHEGIPLNNFNGKDPIGTTVEKLSKDNFQRCITPLEAHFLYLKYPEIVKDCSAYIADPNGSVYLMSQAWLKIDSSNIKSKPHMAHVRETADLERIPSHKIILARRE